MTHLTAAGAAKVADNAYGILITVNTGLTGSITVTDANGTQAVITNPVVGNMFRYFGLTGQVNVNPSATCDITVSILNHQG